MDWILLSWNTVGILYERKSFSTDDIDGWLEENYPDWTEDPVQIEDVYSLTGQDGQVLIIKNE